MKRRHHEYLLINGAFCSRQRFETSRKVRCRHVEADRSQAKDMAWRDSFEEFQM